MNSSASAARGTSDLTPSRTKPPPARRARGLQLERVEQRARLEQRERRGGHVLADELGQVRGLLVGVAPQAERGRDAGGRQARDRDPHVALGERLGHQHGGDGRALGRRRRRAPRARRPSSGRARSPARAARPGRRRPRRPPVRAGRSLASAKSRTDSRSICCSSSGVRSNRSLRPARGCRAGPESFWVAANVRPARVAVRTVAFEAPCRTRCGRVAQPEAVDQPVAREAVERAQPDRHAPLGEVLLRHAAGRNDNTNRCNVDRCRDTIPCRPARPTQSCLLWVLMRRPSSWVAHCAC